MTSMREHREKPHELRLDLPAAHSAERMARSVLRRFAQSEGVAKKEIETLELVASELLSNAVDHGGGKSAMEEADRPGDVRMLVVLTIEPGGGGWSLEVSDQGGGEPKDVEHLVSSSEFPDLEDERGRGFFPMSQLVDSIKVEKSEDGRGLLVSAACRHGQDI